MQFQSNARSQISISQMFTGVMTFLKLKERYVQCTFSEALRLRSKNLYKSNIWTLDKQVSEDEEEGRVALTNHYTVHPATDEGGIVLLDTELPAKRARKKTACCMCCGIK